MDKVEEVVCAAILAGIDPKHRREMVITFLAAQICQDLWPDCREDKQVDEHMRSTIESVEAWLDQHIKCARMIGV